MESVTFKDIELAHQRLSSCLAPTPLTFSPTLSEIVEREVYFKWDNKLRTGSFKERGALNFIRAMAEQKDSRTLCAASLGNHALALSYHASRFGVKAEIVMPSSAPLVKVERTKRFGAEIHLQGNTFADALEYAKNLAAENNFAFVPAYDHPWIIAGQGTCGLEIVQQLPEVDLVISPVGGGGLCSGIALAVNALKPEAKVMGVQSEWALKSRSVTDKTKVEKFSNPTLADGIAVKNIGELTGQLLARYVEHMFVVNELDIAESIVQFIRFEKTVVEGAGAAGLIPLLKRDVPAKFKKIVVVVSGSNIDINVLARLIDRDMAERGRMLKISIAAPDRPGTLHNITGLISNLGANILNVKHDRMFIKDPSHVEIGFLLEVRDAEHKQQLLQTLRDAGLHLEIHE